MENVAGMLGHPHFEFLIALWHQLGMQLISREVQTTAGHIPVNRRRIFKRRDVEIDPSVLRILEKCRLPKPFMPATLASMRSLFGPHVMCEELRTTPEELMRHPKLFPGKTVPPDNVLECRDARNQEVIMAVMASYRSSIHFSYDFLLSPIVKGIRFLHPFEVLSALGFPHEIGGTYVRLPADYDLCFRMLGNSYIPAQSGLAWIKADQLWAHVMNIEITVPSMETIADHWQSIYMQARDFEPTVQHGLLTIAPLQDPIDAISPTVPFPAWSDFEFTSGSQTIHIKLDRETSSEDIVRRPNLPSACI